MYLFFVTQKAAYERRSSDWSSDVCASDLLWHLHLERQDGSRFSIRARALVNDTGTWVASFIEEQLRQASPHGMGLIQGSHIVVPKLYEGEIGRASSRERVCQYR